MRGTWLLAAVAVVLLAVLAGALMQLRRETVAGAAETGVVLTPAPIERALSLTGMIRARHVVAVPAVIEGVIEQYLVEIGEEVYEDQLLARIGSMRLESARDAAKAEVERIRDRINVIETTLISARLEESRASADASRARSELQRVEKIYQRQQLLYREGATPRLTFEKAEKDYQLAKAESESLDDLARQVVERVSSLNRELDAARRMLEEKQLQLEDAEKDMQAADVRSPVDGVVVGRYGDAGDPVDASIEDLIQIAVDLSALEVVVEAAPGELREVQEGQPAALSIAEAFEEIIEGIVREIGEGRLVVEFTSPSSAIRPGTTAQVRITLP